jgi:hypothetical protein
MRAAPHLSVRPRWLGTMRVLVLVAAVSAIVLGLLIGCTSLAAAMLSDQADLVSTATFAAAIVGLTLGLGLALAWHAWRAALGHPSIDFRPKKVGLWILLYVIILAVGQMILVLDLLPAITFPPFHIAAAVLPALIVLALAARALAGTTTWRDLSLQIASGAFLSTASAFLLEAVAIVGFLVAALLGLAVRPGGGELLQRLSASLDNPTWAQDPSLLVPTLASPLLVGLAFTLFAGIVPIVEEAVKTVGVGLRAYRRPSMAQCYLWGMAGGAGFAVVEALLNTLGGLESWAPMAALRAAATLLHCTTGALMGLAWYHVLTRRGWASALGLYATSVAIHALWNSVSASMTLVSLRTFSGQAAEGGQLLAGMAAFALLAALLGLALGMVLTLALLTSYVHRATDTEPPEQEGLTSLTDPGSAAAGKPQGPG